MTNSKNLIKLQTNLEVEEIDGEHRVLRFIGSTDALDRDQERITQDGIQVENFMKNPVILYGHDYGGLPVGKAIAVESTDKGLVFDVKFPTRDEAGEHHFPFVDSVYRLSKSGFLNTTSVGFMPLEKPERSKKPPYRTWTKVDLLELSIVPVPSNPDALRLAMDEGVIETEDIKFIRGLLAEETAKGKNVKWATAIDDILGDDEVTLPDEQLKDVLVKLDDITERLSDIEDAQADLTKCVLGVDAITGSSQLDIELRSLRNGIDRILSLKNDLTAPPVKAGGVASVNEFDNLMTDLNIK